MSDSATTGPTSGVRVTKLLTVIEGPGNEVRAELLKEHFDDLEAEELNEAVALILRSAAVIVKKESDSLLQRPETLELATPINLGSLYDEVVFDSGIYSTEHNELLVNTSFGRLADPSVKFGLSLKHASEVIAYISEKFAGQEQVESL